MPGDTDARAAPCRPTSAPANQPVEVHLVFPADPRSIRRALDAMLGKLSRYGLDAEDLGWCEILLAEVLNNVSEHAYRHHPGRVEISAQVAPPRGAPRQVSFTVLDDGRPMPGGQLPPFQPVPIGPGLEDLPEGGFGWNMIRALSTDVSYQRTGPRNRLDFTLTLERKDALR